jgi:hypothetical protein
MALQRVWIPSPCYNGRNSGGVRLIVLHTAEGARTIEDLGHFFQNYNNQVSSHTGADDKLGKIGEYVTRGNASWTCANYNPVAVQLELCGFASWTTAQWKNDHANMLRNCADWIAEEAKKFGLPITKLSAGQAQGSGRGVCQHRDLGAGGGGHTDCGNGFPIDYVLDMARGGGTTAPPSTGGDKMAERWLVKGLDAKTAMAFPPGATRIRMYSNAAATVDIDWVGGGQNGTMTPNYDNAPDWAIPSGAKGAVFRRRDGGTNEVSVAVG